jgi:streptogramin lyase
VTEFSTGAPAVGIAAGPDGNVWFTEPDARRIGRITPKGRLTEFSAGITSGYGPVGITAGPDEDLWFTVPGELGFVEHGHEGTTGQIGRISTGVCDRTHPSTRTHCHGPEKAPRTQPGPVR